MGFITTPSDEMGEYSIEVRSESFYLRGRTQRSGDVDPPHHSIIVYPHTEHPVSSGTIEILLADIPMIRAALDQVESVVNGTYVESVSMKAIREDRAEIEATQKEATRRLEDLNKQSIELQRRCTHPNAQLVRSMGDTGIQCHDCGFLRWNWAKDYPHELEQKLKNS